MSHKKPIDELPIALLPELNLFVRDSIQVSVQQFSEEEILPTGTWSSNSEICFNLTGDPETFLDPSSLRLRVSARIVKQDGTHMAATDQVAPCANFGASLFERVSVRLGNSTQISGYDNLYPYLTYFLNVYKSPEFYQKQMNFPLMLFRDTENKFDTMDDTNLGFKSRQSAVEASHIFFMEIPIYSPITLQKKLLPPNVDLFVQLSHNKSDFLIMAGVPLAQRNHVVLIESIALLYRKVRLNAGLHINFMNALRRGPAIYSCKYHQMIEFTRAPGTSVITETLFTERLLPSFVHLFVVLTERRLGNYAQNPWLSAIENISEIRLTSGNESYPSMGYKIDIPTKNVLPAYLTMSRAVGSLNNKDGRANGLNTGSWIQGYAMFSFDLTRTFQSGDSQVGDAPRISDLQVHATLKQPSAQSLSFIFILERNSNIYLHDNSAVTTDFVA